MAITVPLVRYLIAVAVSFCISRRYYNCVPITCYSTFLPSLVVCEVLEIIISPTSMTWRTSVRSFTALSVLLPPKKYSTLTLHYYAAIITHTLETDNQTATYSMKELSSFLAYGPTGTTQV